MLPIPRAQRVTLQCTVRLEGGYVRVAIPCVRLDGGYGRVAIPCVRLDGGYARVAMPRAGVITVGIAVGTARIIKGIGVVVQ